jgi:hypothetical protein
MISRFGSAPAVRSAGRVRPKAGAEPHDIIVLKRSYAAHGKLSPRSTEASRIARSAQVPLDKSVPPMRRFRRLHNIYAAR